MKNGRAMWMYEGRGSRGKTVEPRIGLACSGNSKEGREVMGRSCRALCALGERTSVFISSQ